MRKRQQRRNDGRVSDGRTCGVEQTQRVRVISNHHRHRIVIEDLYGAWPGGTRALKNGNGNSFCDETLRCVLCVGKPHRRDVLARELVGGIRDQKAGLVEKTGIHSESV